MYILPVEHETIKPKVLVHAASSFVRAMPIDFDMTGMTKEDIK